MSIYHYDIGCQVGELYMPGRTLWRDHAEYSGFKSDGHLFRMFLSAPTPSEVEDVRIGEAEFALFPWGEVLFFLYRFGRGFPWRDTSFSWHLVDAEDREVPGPHPVPLDPRDPLYVVLVDASTGIVRVIRRLALSREFTAALRECLRWQSRMSWPGDAQHDRLISSAYERFSTPSAMLQHAMVRTAGHDR